MPTHRSPAVLPLRRRITVVAALAALAVTIEPVTAQTGQQGQQQGQQQGRPRRGGGQGVNREQMWYAPTAEDWKKPVLVHFQRTWEDALAVSKETGKPILICVNMDGEIASEHYAGVRYRQPDKAKLYEPYVCVIASVYRHNPRDFDENGRRILCPRFGSVTCGEHIRIEPLLYKKFFDGRRIAPRHIMVELDGKEAYDVYYTWDTDSVFAAIRDGIANRKIKPKTIVKGDRTIIERVASRDNTDRTAVENAYLNGDTKLREQLLEAAKKNIDKAPDGLLRLAVFGFDTEFGKRAREALANATSASSADVINEALRVPMDSKEREGLIEALERLGKTSRQARTLAVVHRGLGEASSSVDVKGWSAALQGAEYPAPAAREMLETRLDERTSAYSERPKDAATALELAEASLALAVAPSTKRTITAGRRMVRDYARIMYEDARAAALDAERLGASGWRVNAALAITAKYFGNTKEAYSRAQAAMKTLPAGEQSYNAMEVLALFAQSRQQAIIDKWRAKEDWPASWLTDIQSTYAVLAKHPLSTDAQVIDHYDFLRWLRATGQASRVLQDGLRRFPDSWALHARFRRKIMREKGIDGLEATYETMLEKKDAPRNLEWFAGYASITAAEYHRRRNNFDQALAAYERAIAHYSKAGRASPGSRPTCDHYVAMALAGRARIAYEQGDQKRAVANLLECFARRPSAAAQRDGLNISAVDTAKMVRAKLKELEMTDLENQLQAALDRLDPALLQLPDYERDPRQGRRRGRRGQRRR